jgi:hypothetical protein
VGTRSVAANLHIAAIDVQESKQSAKRPDSVWHAVVFVGMSGVLHMPTRTRAWHPNSIGILNINNEDAAAGAVEVSSRGRWIFIAAWARGDENG